MLKQSTLQQKVIQTMKKVTEIKREKKKTQTDKNKYTNNKSNKKRWNVNINRPKRTKKES